METAKSQLKELLARNQVQIAIEILKDLTQHDVFKLNNVVLLSSQWHKYLEFLEKGNMDSRDLTLQFNQIHIALSHLIDALEDDVILDLPASFWDNLPK